MRASHTKSPAIAEWTARGFVLVGMIAVVSATSLHGQDSCPRILKQDSTLNNLVDPPGYQTVKLGTLGAVVRAGSGDRVMILIPGLGFGAGIFEDFMNGLAADYRMYAVTLPGFGGTAAPPCPPETTSFGAQTWTTGALSALERLIETERIRDAVVVGHWLTGTQLAVRLATRHPDRIKAVILLAGVPRWVTPDTARAAYYSTLERRIASVDRYLAPRWFKTVTRETWDDNNFLPGDYAVHPVRGLRLWREAATPKLHVWIRYLSEFNAQDLSLEISRLKVPTLLLEPGLEGLWHDGQNYMRDNIGHRSWEGILGGKAKIVAKTIPDSRACLWFDQPKAVARAMGDFLQGVD
jgi:pimeloyl-ACP methyl ester carboxylesterase